MNKCKRVVCDNIGAVICYTGIAASIGAGFIWGYLIGKYDF